MRPEANMAEVGKCGKYGDANTHRISLNKKIVEVGLTHEP
jgi:hypothetical protein